MTLADVAAARSLLFVPGSRPDRFAKAAAACADLVVVDLEDAVLPGEKAGAREAVTTWLNGPGSAAVRVNGTRSPEHAADVAALVGAPGLLAVVVPMVEDPAALVAAHDRLGGAVPLVALVETAIGVQRCSELAGATGVARLAFGHLDLSADTGSALSDRALLFARSTLVIASAAARLPGPVEGVTTDVDDSSVAGAEALLARELGFTGKFCVHPRQVEAVNTAFAPTQDEIDWAERVLQVGRAAGAVAVDGQMVDAPVIARAESVMARGGRG